MNQSPEEFLLQWNTGSLVSHWGEFKNYILNKNPLVAAIQETRFLDSDDVNYNFKIRNYSLYASNINLTPRRGGSALYISNKLLHHEIKLQTPLNVVGVKIKIAQIDLSVLSVYLSPNHPIPPNQIHDLFSQISQPCIIMGDFNAHHVTWGCATTNQRGTQLFNVINALDLMPINNRVPTHRHIHNSEVTHSVIDLAITDTNTATLFTQHVGADTFFSDHYPIHYTLNVPSGQTNFNFLPRWNFKKADWASFQKHIDESLIDPPADINSFLNVILAAAHQYIPHTGPPKPNKNAPFWNEKCQRAVAIRKRALRIFERCICDAHAQAARQARDEADEIIKTEKIKSWQTFSSNFNRFTPLSKIWSLIKCFSNRSAPTYKIPHLNINNTHYLIPSDVATQFALHYADISSSQQYTPELTNTLDHTLTTLSFQSDNTEPYNATFTLSELTYAISRCGNTSVGPDQIAYPFFKNLTETGLNTLLDTLNSLWENNTYPTSWSSSTLIPILKPKKPSYDPASYRPISLTSCASKLFERMVNGRIRVYLEENKILSEFQNGFRPNRSTADSIVHFIDDIQQSFINKSHTYAIFIDFKNAFDKVNKAALQIKLHKVGLRGKLVSYIQNFLKDRTFNVRLGNTYSSSYTLDHGLPQGSVLSPTLFLIMINDLFESFHPRFKHSMYADDVAIWYTHSNSTVAYSNMQIALKDIQTWCEKWGLTLSPTKTVAMYFPPKGSRNRESPPKFRMNNLELQYVTHFKYLGVVIDNKLNFNEHFKHITQKCARRINIIKCIAGKDWGADRSTLLQLYISLIRPILDYNAFLFDDIATQKIDSLQIIQNDALRIVTGAFRTTNTYNLHIDTNLPLLRQRRKLQLLRFFGRMSSFPDSHSYKILTNPGGNTANKFPRIFERVEKACRLFQISRPSILPAPPISSFYLQEIDNIVFLLDEPKKQFTALEIQQTFLEFKEKHTDYIFYYTDGSVADGKSAAAVVSNIYKKQNRVNDDHSIFSAELIAIHGALRHIMKTDNKKLVICSDSASALKAIQTKKKRKT